MNKYITKVILVAVLQLVGWQSLAQTHSTPQKRGILLVTFGTSYPEAQGSLLHLDEEVRKAFPGEEIRWAYTSKFIRRKLRKQGEVLDSPAEALAEMSEDGFTHVAVQSLHIIPGDEFDYLKATVDAFQHIPKGFKKLTLGKPLLFHHSDLNKAAESIADIYSKNLGENEALVLMGHGTTHASNVFYPGFQYYLNQHAHNCFIACVEGFPTLEDTFHALNERGIKRVRLAPFMSVAGDHARNDMAGDDPESWKSILEAHGFQVESILKGMAGFDAFAAIWIDHLKKALHELE